MSSPGEVIVVKEESLSDSENTQGGSRLEKKRKKSVAQSPSYGLAVDKDDACYKPVEVWFLYQSKDVPFFFSIIHFNAERSSIVYV